MEDGQKIIGDISDGNFKPIIPRNLRHACFMHIHKLSHPGVNGSQKLICRNDTWPNMRRDITLFVKSCSGCQSSKVHLHNHTKLRRFLSDHPRLKFLHLDLVGPLPQSPEGLKYLLTMRDRSTRLFLAIPLTSCDTITVRNAFLLNWVAIFGALRQY